MANDSSEISPSERELEILKALWESGPASVREIHERMCPQAELAFNTIQTQLRIMDEKGLVSHRAEGRTFIYTPLYSRERVSTRFLDRVFDGALDQLVLSLLRAKDVETDELKRLEGLIADARKRKQGGGKP
jgi:BlaI family transcriptional regulator, penicillinase repressor